MSFVKITFILHMTMRSECKSRR